MRIIQSGRVNNNNNSAIFIVDNGGWTVKFGLIPTTNNNNGAVVGDTTTTCCSPTIPSIGGGSINSIMYNATAQPPHQLTVLAGDEITTHMKNLGQLAWKHPMERGMVCDGETQFRVWNRMLEIAGVIPAAAAATTTTTGGGAAAAGFSATTAARRGKNPPAAPSSSQTARRTTTTATAAATVSSRDCTFLLLEPPFVPSAISEGVDCILFRELGLGRVARLMGPCMAAMRYFSFCRSMAVVPATTTSPPPRDRVGSSSPPLSSSSSSGWRNDDTNCCCVVDSGYSFTHVVPAHHDGAAIVDAIRRLDLGGKVLTNLLKEFVTYRQWNMMDEYHIVNDVKEQLCFVSDRFDAEMTEARNTRRGLRWFDREYLLPDFVNTFRGTVRLPEPLQRKRELEEMERMKLDLERCDAERKRRKLFVEEARELLKENANEEEVAANEEMEAMETDEKSDGSTKLTEASGGKAAKKAGGINPKKEAKRKKRRPSSTADGTGEEDDAIILDDTSSDSDSDDETDQQRLHRLKAMRDAERKRREQESLDRQALAMSVERFAIPEVLFRPSDIGLDCGGIVEAIVESIAACPPTVRAAMYHNVLLVGGNAKIPGFRDRVESDLRKLAPTNYEVRVYLPEDPISYAWEGAKQFAQREGFREQYSIDRASWEAMKKLGKTQREIWGNMKNDSSA